MSKLNRFLAELGLSSTYNRASSLLSIRSADGAVLRTVAIKSIAHGQRLTAQANMRPLDFVRWLGDFNVVHVVEPAGEYHLLVTNAAELPAGGLELRGVIQSGLRTGLRGGKVHTVDLQNTTATVYATDREYAARRISSGF